MNGKKFLVGVFRDITDFKQTEETLRKNEERFRGIVESMADWIWEVDRQGRYTYCSKKIESESLSSSLLYFVLSTPLFLLF